MSASVIRRIDTLFSAPSEERVPSIEEGRATTTSEGEGSHAQALLDLDRYIDDDISHRLDAPHMTWRRLDANVKWRLLRAYMARQGVVDGDDGYERVRKLLKGRQLMTVDYDVICREVTRINHKDCEGIDEMESAANELESAADEMAATAESKSAEVHHAHEDGQRDEGDADERPASGVGQGAEGLVDGPARDEVVEERADGPDGAHRDLVDRHAEQDRPAVGVAEDRVVDDAVDRVEDAALL
jgi:hypothetical protein